MIEPPLPILGAVHTHRVLRIAATTGESTAHWLLKGGATYRLTASGVWHGATGAQARSDAECTKTSNGWLRSDAGITIGGDQLRRWGLRWEAVHDNGGGCDPRRHTYRLVLHQFCPAPSG